MDVVENRGIDVAKGLAIAVAEGRVMVLILPKIRHSVDLAEDPS